MIRDFTYVDDIAESLIRIIYKPATPDDSFDTNNPNPSTSWAPHRIFNVGNSNPVNLMDFLKALEDNLSIKAKINFLPMQSGDVAATSSDTHILESYINYKPTTTVKEGIAKFVNWYKKFYDKEVKFR